jgi:hypothetical protein
MASVFLWSEGAERAEKGMRRPWLLLVKGGKVMVFAGVSIPNVCTIRSTWHHPLSSLHTDYLVRTHSGVRAIYGWEDWETGRFLDSRVLRHKASRGIRHWSYLASVLRVSAEEAERFLREWRPEEAARLDVSTKELDNDKK